LPGEDVVALDGLEENVVAAVAVLPLVFLSVRLGGLESLERDRETICFGD